MAKKITLSGRKRFSELGYTEAAEQKKAQLEALKETVAETLATPEPSAPAQPKPQSETTAAAAAHKTQVSFIVDEIYQQVIEMEQAGDRNRRQFSPQVIHNFIVNELKKILRKKIRFEHARGTEPCMSQAICQSYIDEIRERLQQRGIRINPLKVTELS